MSWLKDMVEKARRAIGRDPRGSSLIARRGVSWDETVIAGLTPARMAQVLRDAAEGAAEEFLVLTEELEETDPHYRAVLSTRKLAVTGLEPEVEAASATARDEEIAAFVREVVSAPAFAGLMMDLLDGLGKGYAVCQIIWDTSGERWRPAGYEWVDPRAFVWDSRRRRLLLKDDDGKGQDMPPARFVVHVPRLKSGNPVRGALARVCAWAALYKNYTLKDWMRFLDVYGMPVRLGKYSATATEEDKRKLLRALYALGSDAAAVVPASASIEFVQAGSGMRSGGPVFGEMAEYIDRQLSKAVLGQTMTTDDGSSLAQARVHEEVRGDILRADARQLAASISRDLIRPLVALNFGADAAAPRLSLPVVEAEDIKTWAETVAVFVDRGLPVSRRQVRDKLGLDEPEGEKDALTIGTDAAKHPENTNAGEVETAARRHEPGCPCCAGRGLAAAQPADEEMDGIDELVEAALPQLGEDDPLRPMVQPLLRAAADAEDYEDFRRRLEKAVARMDDRALIARLGELGFIARALGDARDEPRL